jgi:hypothetical protein
MHRIGSGTTHDPGGRNKTPDLHTVVVVHTYQLILLWPGTQHILGLGDGDGDGWKVCAVIL